jgi:peptidoglycan hydrolase CwlO-like protein
MQQHIKFCLLTSALMVLAGCAVNPADCDPANRDASIVAKARCNYSGAYDERVQGKQKILLDEQKTNKLFRDVYTAVEKEKREVSSELKNNRAEYSALTNSLNALLDELQQKDQGNSQVQAEVAALKQELENIKNQDDPVVMKKQVELDQLKNKVMELQQGLGLR